MQYVQYDQLLRFLALRHMAAGARAAAVQVVLDVGLAQSQAGWAAVNHAANGWAVGFTKVGDCEKGAEGVAAHGAALSPRAGSASGLTSGRFFFGVLPRPVPNVGLEHLVFEVLASA